MISIFSDLLLRVYIYIQIPDGTKVVPLVDPLLHNTYNFLQKTNPPEKMLPFDSFYTHIYYTLEDNALHPCAATVQNYSDGISLSLSRFFSEGSLNSQNFTRGTFTSSLSGLRRTRRRRPSFTKGGNQDRFQDPDIDKYPCGNLRNLPFNVLQILHL